MVTTCVVVVVVIAVAYTGEREVSVGYGGGGARESLSWDVLAEEALDERPNRATMPRPRLAGRETSMGEGQGRTPGLRTGAGETAVLGGVVGLELLWCFRADLRGTASLELE